MCLEAEQRSTRAGVYNYSTQVQNKHSVYDRVMSDNNLEQEQEYSAQAIIDLTNEARLDLAIALELLNPEGHNPPEAVQMILLTFFGHERQAGAGAGAGAGPANVPM